MQGSDQSQKWECLGGHGLMVEIGRLAQMPLFLIRPNILMLVKRVSRTYPRLSNNLFYVLPQNNFSKF